MSATMYEKIGSKTIPLYLYYSTCITCNENCFFQNSKNLTNQLNDQRGIEHYTRILPNGSINNADMEAQWINRVPATKAIQRISDQSEGQCFQRIRKDRHCCDQANEISDWLMILRSSAVSCELHIGASLRTKLERSVAPFPSSFSKKSQNN